MFESLNLKALQFNSTHHTDHSHTWIDHIAVSKLNRVLQDGQLAAPGLSKHDLLFLSYSIRVPKCKPKLVTYRDFKNLDSIVLLRDAATLPWNYVHTFLNLDDKIDMFNKMILDLYK